MKKSHQSSGSGKIEKLDVEWSTCSKHPDDVAFAKDLQDMVDKTNELVKEVESLKNRVKK